MIEEISQLQMPAWLSAIDPHSELPSIEKIITDSLYYPGGRLNGTPVKYLASSFTPLSKMF
ncbi:hypothetical protein SAMN05660443_0635 [Marinospirillum celere]|uniref:Uncharacterized protein n=1 Tax=Marinospirillum celere TaxID=1122252 RepID=A0A1I1EIW0_9GAMM|nr:hypothetical protein SAMN05660443_0635 [Marinospirillum celere]